MLFNKKEMYVCNISGLNPETDNVEFIIGKISGIIMGITNFHRYEHVFVIGRKADGEYTIEFKATRREAEKIGEIVDGSLPINTDIKVCITNDLIKG